MTLTSFGVRALITCLALWHVSRVEGFHKAKKLYQKLFDHREEDGFRYNKYVRPVLNETMKIDVYIGLKLSQLIDVVSWSSVTVVSAPSNIGSHIPMQYACMFV